MQHLKVFAVDNEVSPVASCPIQPPSPSGGVNYST